VPDPSSVSNEDGIPLEEFERAERTTKAVLTGFGAVKDKLEVERQARLDRGLDSLEGISRGLKREDVIAKRQVNELLGEAESAVKLFWEVVFEPEEFRKKHGL
jgi:hypothetical protein